MLRLTRPDDAAVQRALARAAEQSFSYANVRGSLGLGAGDPPPAPGYEVLHRRVALGTGQACFERARTAVAGWRMFDVGWAELRGVVRQPTPGDVVGVLVRVLGLWTLGASRVVYTFDDAGDGSVHRTGFAYGTLPGHPASGEERFGLEWNRADDSVEFEILSFSRPAWLAGRLAAPMAHRLQRRFLVDAGRALARAAAPGAILPD